jgi:hypothetical protein
MEYRMLGATGAAVSTLALGTMTFGTETYEVGARAQLDRYLEVGANLAISVRRSIATVARSSTPPRAAASTSSTIAQLATPSSSGYSLPRPPP